MAVFTTFAATLARQPSAASLALRLNKLQRQIVIVIVRGRKLISMYRVNPSEH